MALLGAGELFTVEHVFQIAAALFCDRLRKPQIVRSGFMLSLAGRVLVLHCLTVSVYLGCMMPLLLSCIKNGGIAS